MSRTSNPDGEDEYRTGTVYHRHLGEDVPEPTNALASHLADLQGVPINEITPLYECIEELVEHLYSAPIPRESQVEITFNCQEYRITLYQDGHAVFRELDGTATA